LAALVTLSAAGVAPAQNKDDLEGAEAILGGYGRRG